MKILLDESLPARLADEFPGHKVSTVVKGGWSGKKNGELLKFAESKFGVFITADQNLQYQLNLIRSKIPVIVLAAKTNRYDDLRPLVPKILNTFGSLKSKGIIRIP